MRTRGNIHFIFVILILSLFVGISGIGEQRVAAQSEPLRIALASDPVTFDFPNLEFTRAARLVANQIYEGLFRYHANGQIALAGATGYDVSEDGLTYTIHLHPAARWSDGEAVIAQHYADGLLRFGGTPWDFLLSPISGYEAYSQTGDPSDVGIEILDDYTLLITLETPTVHFPHVLAMPRTSDPVRLDVPENQRPYVNNGPYELYDWVTDTSLTLIKNDSYWNAGAVEIDEIYLPIIPALSDQLNRYAAGLLDVSSYPTEALPTILGDPVLSAELRKIPQPGVFYLGMNVSRLPTDSLDLRIALASAIDRREILDEVLGTPWREVATGVIPPELLGYQATDVGYPFDLQVAQDHLTAYMNLHGIMDPADIRVELWYNSAALPVVDRIANMWVDNLGLSVAPIEWDWSAYLSELEHCWGNPEDPDCTYNSYRLGWIGDYWDPWNFLYDLFHPDSRFNFTHWESPAYRSLLEAAALETDETARLDLFQQAERILVEEDVAIVPIFFYDETTLIKPYVNYEFPIDGSAPYLIDWSLQAVSTYVVESTADPGEPGDLKLTLREAIEAANTNPGPDVITFDIPVVTDLGCDQGTGVCTIRPLAALPPIEDGAILDGYTQPGAAPNTNPSELGNNAALKIELDGSLAGAAYPGLQITAADCMVRGLVINRFNGNGIDLQSSAASGNRIEGNFIGTDVSGNLNLGNANNGVQIVDGSGNTIGGLSPQSNNLISGNQGDGITIQGTANGNMVVGNLIGTNASGTIDLGNALDGVRILGPAWGNTIGGNAPEARNIISGNNARGVTLEDSAYENIVQGNFIGTDSAGTARLGNSFHGVLIANSADNLIGGTAPGAANLISANGINGITVGSIGATGNQLLGNAIGTDITREEPLGNSGNGVDIFEASGSEVVDNVIFYNGGHGVRVAGAPALGNRISQNAIHGNVRNGIETLEGGNAELEPPEITAMLGDLVLGEALPGSLVELFADLNGEGEIYLDTVAADQTTGDFTYSGNLEGPNITATATDMSGNTSEFSQAVAWAPDNCEVNDTFDHACDVATRLGFSFAGSGTFSSFLSHSEDVDWFYLDLPDSVSPGSQVTFNLSGIGGGELPANFDLLVLAELEVDPTTGASPLQGVPLQGVPLQVVPLQGVPLEGVDAEGVPLEGVPLEGVDVHDIPLQGVPLQGVPLQGVPLQGVPPEGVPLQGVGFHSGRLPEEVVTLFRGGMTGRYHVLVWSSTGEYSTGAANSPYEVGVTAESLVVDACTTGLNRALLGDPLEEPLGNTTNPKTLIFVHRPRMSALYGEQLNDLLMTALAEELAPHPLVDGVIVDLGNPTYYMDQASFQVLENRYASWDGQGCNPEIANLITLSIKQVLLHVLDAYGGSIENLVLVGGDKVIPFRRVPDEVVRTPDGATVPNEYDYQSEVDGIKKVGGVDIHNGPTYATLRLMYYLSDDFYADSAPILLEHGHELSVPDMPIGRLVETPMNIVNQIIEFVNRDGMMGDGVTLASLTSGYSFLVDQALGIDGVLASKGFDPHHTLISNGWGRADLLNAYVNQPYVPQIDALNAHFDHWRIAPADVQTPDDLIWTEDLLSSGANFGGTLLFSVGCHIGLNLPDEDALNDPEPGALDFPQALISQGATLVGSTGFSYGDDAALAYSEELMLGMARFLGGGNLGQALVDAKRDYLLNQARLDPIHEKILMQVVYFGLPMWQLEAPVNILPEGITFISSTSTLDGLTVQRFEIQVDTDQRSEVTIPGRGSYFSLAGRTQAALFRPIQPQARVDDLSVPGEVVHGALFIGGTYVDITDFDPAITMPSWTRGNPEPQFIYEGWDPVRFWSVAQLEQLDGELDERLILVPGQFQVDEGLTLSTGTTLGTQRLYDSLEFQIVYAPDAVEFQEPIIERIEASVDSTQSILVRVHVEDPPDPDGLTSEILRVLITYTPVDGGTVWESEDLEFNPTSETWEGLLALDAPVVFFVQALDGSGNVGMFAGTSYFSPIPVSVHGPTMSLVGQPVSFYVTHTLDEPAILWDFDDGSQTAGQPTVIHAFSQPGHFFVTVRVIGTQGEIGQGLIEVEVLADLEALNASQEQWLNSLVEYIGDAGSLPNNAIKPPGNQRRHALLEKLEAVAGMIEQGEFNGALSKVNNDILAKMDGCPPTADKNDWILSCDHQEILQARLDNLVAVLESLLWSVRP